MNEVWCLEDNEMSILLSGRALVGALCEVEVMDRKRTEHLMLMLSLDEAMDQLATSHIVSWQGHWLGSEDCHVLRRAIEILS